MSDIEGNYKSRFNQSNRHFATDPKKRRSLVFKCTGCGARRVIQVHPSDGDSVGFHCGDCKATTEHISTSINA